MGLKPLQDKVIVKMEPRVEETTAQGLIILPSGETGNPKKGQVVSVGPGRYLENGILIKPDVKKGDHVIFGQYTGTEVEFESDKYSIIAEGDLLAVLR